MADLTERGQVPPDVMGRIHIQVMDGQDLPGDRRRSAADTAVAGQGLDVFGDLIPVGRVIPTMATFHVWLPLDLLADIRAAEERMVFIDRLIGIDQLHGALMALHLVGERHKEDLKVAQLGMTAADLQVS